MGRCVRLAGTILAMWLEIVCAHAQTAPAAPMTIDAAGYADDAAVQAAWRPMQGSAPASAPVALATAAGRQALRMPCHFAGTKNDRASWDKAVRLDLAEPESLRFQFLCRDRSPVSYFSFYLHSGQGWYSASFGAFSSDDWTTVTIRKTDTRVEERPGGWGAIDTIRISAWRSEDRDTEFFVRDVQATGGGGSVVVVRGESLAAGPGNDLDTACQYSGVVAERLAETGIPFSTMSDLDLTAQRLEGKRLVILPYNPKLPPEAESLLARFLQNGGKALTFFGMAPGLRTVAGIEGGRFIGQTHPGHFAIIRPSASAPLDGMLLAVVQASWNLIEAKAVPGRSHIAAEWVDQDGLPTGDAAIVVSDNCIQMTHVLLPDDPPGKRRLVLAMAGALVPDLWPVAASHSLERIGWLGSHQGLVEARRLAEAQGAPPEATANVREAKTLSDQAKKSFDGKRYAEAMATAEEADLKCTLAYCCLEKPAPVVVRASRLPSAPAEHRAFWCHSAFGVAGMDWDQAVKTLADNGFTDIQPNMMWGATAYYPSAVLPVAPEVAARGDQVALCLAACRKYGVACHVWKVCWNMGGHAPDEYVARMKKEGRTQVAFDGKADDQWLCPSNPLNRQQEIDAMVEVATKYDVDGVHFDYIRYPDPDSCFCPACRESFEKSIGAKVASWPADLRSDARLAEKWGDYRRANITAVVAAVSEQLRKMRPKVKISAAVFPNWPGDRNSVGQDWKLWCDRGYLDFVCPMDYTANSQEFARMVAKQMKWAGRVSCYPGIGLSASGGGFDVFTLFDQIAAARRLGTGGFTVFNYGPEEARTIVPLCGMGITKK